MGALDEYGTCEILALMSGFSLCRVFQSDAASSPPTLWTYIPDRRP